MEGTMNTIQKTTIVATAALALGAWGMGTAQEQTGDGQQTRVQQREQTVTQQQQKTAVQQQQKITVQQREQTAVQQQQKITVQRRTKTGDQAEEQNSGAAGKTHTRQLGPGDGIGNQGVPPADGTGFGSPGRLGSGPQQGAAGKAAGKQAGKGGVKSAGSSTGWRQSRARSLSGAGPGGALCDGSRRVSTMGAGGLGGFGRPRGGHR
jgi:hypothetical protein